MLEDSKYSGKIKKQQSLLEKMGVGGCWDGGQQVVTIKKMTREGLLGKMTFEQKHEEGEGVEQTNIWGKSFPSHVNSHFSAVRQGCIQGAARNPTDWNKVGEVQSSRKRSL